MAHASALGKLSRQPSSRLFVRPRLLEALMLVESWLDRRRQRVALRELDDHMLRDIGLSRAAAEAEAAKRFWE